VKSAFATFEFANSNSRPTPGVSKHFLQTEFDQDKDASNEQIRLLQCAGTVRDAGGIEWNFGRKRGLGI
jgi:hypothetical protein